MYLYIYKFYSGIDSSGFFVVFETTGGKLAKGNNWRNENFARLSPIVILRATPWLAICFTISFQIIKRTSCFIPRIRHCSFFSFLIAICRKIYTKAAEKLGICSFCFVEASENAARCKSAELISRVLLFLATSWRLPVKAQPLLRKRNSVISRRVFFTRAFNSSGRLINQLRPIVTPFINTAIPRLNLQFSPPPPPPPGRGK